ncbi:MAG: hypothetical protein FWC68_00800 [Oscillospiraceae bacterium]|nr:hypothetical protein [Oscillospiraceae bacterium]
MKNRIMTLLLIEDNPCDCTAFLEYAKTNENIKFVGVTASDIVRIRKSKKT